MVNMNRIRGQAHNAMRNCKKFVVASLLAAAFTTIAGPQFAASAGSLAGPDLLGIRVGMTPEEALSILKSRAPKEKWQTVSVKLQFDNSKGQRAYVPNGTFRAVLRNNVEHSALNQYGVYLTPIPGKERVAGVFRSQNFGNDRPLHDQVIAGLIEKYGKPSWRTLPGYPEKLIWAFDADGNPRSLGIGNSNADKAGGFPCTSAVVLPRAGAVDVGWSVNYVPVGKTGEGKEISLVKACGSTMVRAEVIAFGPVGGEFVAGLNVELIGHTLATAGKESAVKLTETAIAEELAHERAAAQKRSKPDL